MVFNNGIYLIIYIIFMSDFDANTSTYRNKSTFHIRKERVEIGRAKKLLHLQHCHETDAIAVICS